MKTLLGLIFAYDDKWCYHKLLFFRAIVTAWILIVSTAIPVAIVHGVVDYPYNGRNYTACLFLVENGYNLVLFQVNILFLFFTNIPKRKVVQMIIEVKLTLHIFFFYILYFCLVVANYFDSFLLLI